MLIICNLPFVVDIEHFWQYISSPKVVVNSIGIVLKFLMERHDLSLSDEVVQGYIMFWHDGFSARRKNLWSGKDESLIRPGHVFRQVQAALFHTPIMYTVTPQLKFF